MFCLLCRYKRNEWLKANTFEWDTMIKAMKRSVPRLHEIVGMAPILISSWQGSSQQNINLQHPKRKPLTTIIEFMQSLLHCTETTAISNNAEKGGKKVQGKALMTVNCS